MKPGIAKIIETVCISKHIKYPETDFQIVEITCGLNDADTGSSQ
jgi:hypothetical protein